jgi:hypothetical protein
MSTKSKIPKPKPTREFLGGLYHPEFIPEKVEVANFLVEIDSEEKVRESLSNKVFNSTLETQAASAPIPLTEAEALEADRQIQATLDRIDRLSNSIDTIGKRIDQQVEPVDASGKKKEWRFELDISKKSRVRRAIKKLFGIKTDTITYGMYKEMLAAKATLEQEQGEGYTKGFTDNKGKKKNQKNESNKAGKKNKKNKDSGGFLERSSKKNDSEDDSSLDEEQYLRLFPKIGRDFVYQGDMNRQLDTIMKLVDPLGRSPTSSDVSEARKRAREYKAVLDSGGDGSKKYKDLIKLDDD